MTDADIIVEGYSQRYATAVRQLLGVEGGYVDDPADHGGATKYGISLRFLVAEGEIDLDHDGFADFDLDMDGDIDRRDIRKLTRGDAVWLYHSSFWTPLGCEGFEQPIGEMLFDQAVNGGAAAAKKMLQRAINACLAHLADVTRLAVDGALGPATRLAAMAVLEHPALGMPALTEAYREEVRRRYRAIVAANPTQRRFLKGWLRRADALGARLMGAIAWIGAKLLLGGKWLLGAAGKALGWLIEKPVRIVVTVLALVLAWQMLIVAPGLRRDLATSERAGGILASRVVAEKRAHQHTKQVYRAAQIEAARLDQLRVDRVKHEQQEISDEVVETYQVRLADARSRAEQLRREAARAGEYPAGARGGELLPGAGDAAGRADQAAGDRRLPPSGRSAAEQLERDLVATEQAIQLDALIDWVERQSAVNVNDRALRGDR